MSFQGFERRARRGLGGDDGGNREFGFHGNDGDQYLASGGDGECPAVRAGELRGDCKREGFGREGEGARWGSIDDEAGWRGPERSGLVSVEDSRGAVEQEGDAVVGGEGEGLRVEEREDSDADGRGFGGELSLAGNCSGEKEYEKDGSLREYPLIT